MMTLALVLLFLYCALLSFILYRVSQRSGAPLGELPAGLQKMNVVEVIGGRRRMAYYNRSKGWECPQKSGYLDIYEDQIRGYLRSFHIPEDYQEKILEAHRKLRDACDDTDSQRARLGHSYIE